MKEIKLTTGETTMVDDEDYLILSQRSWRADKDGYVISGASKNNKRYNIRMHRYILGINDPNIVVDHKDFNKLNNQKCNIRPCTRSENNKNVKPKGRSKYLGVMYQKRHFITTNGKMFDHEEIIARIRINGKYKRLGVFNSEEDAAKAYDSVAKVVHGEFANLNFK
jgi:hypothetical protein